MCDGGWCGSLDWMVWRRYPLSGTGKKENVGAVVAGSLFISPPVDYIPQIFHPLGPGSHDFVA